ncbi:MAG: hypothetical protein SynsKO_10780 [Synoicihabitans sp.]
MPKLPFKLPTLPARPRDVVILPDHRFFVRSVDLADVAEAGPINEQIELALEGMAPFPLSQTLWGYWTQPGCDRALVYAAYQKRFTADEMEPWAEAEWVVPGLGLLYALPSPSAATTRVMQSEDGLTAVHYGDDSGVPTMVAAAALTPEISEKEVDALREKLIRSCGGSTRVEDIKNISVVAGAAGSDEIVFDHDGTSQEFALDQVQPLDVREQNELTTRRRARLRDTWMWRGMVAAMITILLAGVSELALWGTGFWQESLHQQVQAQSPIVNEIQTADTLANRIDELHTNRMRPFEMIAIADGPRPESIIFLRTAATGIFTLEIEAETDDSPAISSYVTALTESGKTQGVEILNLDTRGSRSTFRLLVTFTRDAFLESVIEEEPT